jgi:hypothetical protein
MEISSLENLQQMKSSDNNINKLNNRSNSTYVIQADDLGVVDHVISEHFRAEKSRSPTSFVLVG